MNYDFSTLSANDFEELTRDLIGREFGIRFEAFPEGRDDGMDGRHSSGENKTILQAKHYLRSGLSTLKSKMRNERPSIDALESNRYILATSTPLTPRNKSDLAEIIGPSLRSQGDIFGPDDLNALLRKFEDIEQTHSNLWKQSTGVMKSVMTEAVEQALANRGSLPPAIQSILPDEPDSDSGKSLETPRNVVFFVKSSPVDDEFVLWLGPKLEAEGYQVFADILTLQPGDRWRREVNQALEHRAAKVLLLSRGSTLADQAVQDDIDIAIDLGKRLEDPRFIIPLRLEDGQKVKGIGDALPVDFVRGWGEGLTSLVKALQRQKVPKPADNLSINPNWELFRRRGAIPLVAEPERLTSNWLRISEVPDHIHFFEPSGAVDEMRVKQALAKTTFPVSMQGRGFLCFASEQEVDTEFQDIGRFQLKHKIPLQEFVEDGFKPLSIRNQTASNAFNAMLKEAWFRYCKELGFIQYIYSSSVGFHASAEQAPIGKKFPWSKQGDRRSSMLRNIAKGHIWQFGVTALPAFWPFWHFKLKSRVLFAADDGTDAGQDIEDAKKMHRLRRSICKGWRNKQWHGRMLAFLELLSGESAFIRLSLSPTKTVVLEASPILFSSPVSTQLPDDLDADDEELDTSTLGRPDFMEDKVE